MEGFASEAQMEKDIGSAEITEDFSKGDVVKGLNEIIAGFHFGVCRDKFKI